MNEKTVTALWNRSVAEVGDRAHQKIISRFAELVAAVERGACAAACARLRIATGQRIGGSDPETEAWNKALRDAERFIAERSNRPNGAAQEKTMRDDVAGPDGSELSDGLGHTPGPWHWEGGAQLTQPDAKREPK